MQMDVRTEEGPGSACSSAACDRHERDRECRGSTATTGTSPTTTRDRQQVAKQKGEGSKELVESKEGQEHGGDDEGQGKMA